MTNAPTPSPAARRRAAVRAALDDADRAEAALGEAMATCEEAAEAYQQALATLRALGYGLPDGSVPVDGPALVPPGNGAVIPDDPPAPAKPKRQRKAKEPATSCCRICAQRLPVDQMSLSGEGLTCPRCQAAPPAPEPRQPDTVKVTCAVCSACHERPAMTDVLPHMERCERCAGAKSEGLVVFSGVDYHLACLLLYTLPNGRVVARAAHGKLGNWHDGAAENRVPTLDRIIAAVAEHLRRPLTDDCVRDAPDGTVIIELVPAGRTGALPVPETKDLFPSEPVTALEAGL